MRTSRMMVVVAIVLVVLRVADTAADADAAVSPTGLVLTGGELDSSRVVMGMLVEIVHGKGARHRFSGEWAELVTVRGVIEAVDWDRRRLVVAREGDGRTETVAVDCIQTMTVVNRIAPMDSRMVEERSRPFDIENKGQRVFAKLGAGTLSGVVFTVIVADALANDPRSMGGHFLGGAVIGCSVGFPLGVTLVDPYDSWPKTLLAGVIPVAVVIGSVQFRDIQGSNMWFFVLGMAYVVPVIGSLTASELSRKPPQDSQNSRVSVRLGPALNGGFSAVTTLRF